MKELLILCDLFPPAFGPRMGYLCKYLELSGWKPTVVTEHLPDQTFHFLTGSTEVTEIHYYKSEKKWIRQCEWFGVFIRDLLFNYKNRKIEKIALQLCQEHAFQLILCSTFRSFPLSAASKVARRTGLPLVADLRDIIEQYSGYEFISRPLPKVFGIDHLIAGIFKKRSLARRNKILNTVDWITTVSPWHVETLQAYNPHVSLIYNGYDPELFYPHSVRTGQFLLTYTGRIFSTSMRNPALLFEAVAQLSNEGLFSPQTFRIRWHIDPASRQIIEREAEKYGILPYMDFPGYVPAHEIPGILNQSSMLLLLTNKAAGKGPKGIMTTKFFESLAVQKPILCVRGDEGCLEETIRLTQAGLSAHNTHEVLTFIKQYYQQWKLTGTTFIRVNEEAVRNFSRQTQAQQFIQIFTQLTNR